MKKISLPTTLEQQGIKNEAIPIIEEYGNGLPMVTFVACMHGDEKIGKQILERLREQPLIQGTVRLVIANPRAVLMNKRFIEQDLNRCFPGKENGVVEEQLAYQLRKRLNDSDFLIDLHTTTAQTPPFIISRQRKGLVKDLIEATGVKRVVIRPASGTALIDYVAAGVGIELGSHDTPQSLDSGISAALSVMSTLNMVEEKEGGVNERAIEYFKVEESLPMPPRFMERPEGIHNFQMVEKGSVIGTSDGAEIVAEKDFYPILYGEVSYKNTLCWLGEKL